MIGASWQAVGTLCQLAEKRKGKEVTFVVQVPLIDTSWLSHVALTTTSEIGGGATLQLTSLRLREVM